MKKVVGFAIVLGVVLFCQLQAALAGGYVSKLDADYEEKIRQQKIEESHQKLLDKAAPWQRKLLGLIDCERSVFDRAFSAAVEISEEPEHSLDPTPVVLIAMIKLEITAAFEDELKLNPQSTAVDFQRVRNGWLLLRTSPESALNELRRHLKIKIE